MTESGDVMPCPICGAEMPAPVFRDESCAACGLVWHIEYDESSDVYPLNDTYYPTTESVKALVARVKAETREACAKLCDAHRPEDPWKSAAECAASIRAMGE